MPPADERRAEPLARDWPDERLRRMVENALPGAQVLRIKRYGTDDAGTGDETTKGAGYGAPVRIDVRVEGQERSLVLHTATPNEFGHDRRADRAAEVLLAADTFGAVPRHVEVVDVGAYRGAADFVSLRDTDEFYLLTTHARGSVYADDLRQIARRGALEATDLARMRKLADYLANLHSERLSASPAVYTRAIRDLVGSGEGIFGIVDGYPVSVPGAPENRLERIEERCLAWRAKLKRRHERLARIHGDFHPFNLLFDERSELALLDASRGSVGEPADDVACLSINYAFFSLGHPGAWRGAFRGLFREFWERYLARTGDSEILSTSAPFLAWRGLVLACPKWYPELAEADRERLLDFVEAALDDERFSPDLADDYFDS